ncbi:hypothetical_protein [Leishmania infantum]|uniref:Hypothetical_protein n=1 Tax=Leishmania infantum TaxID=5671 RepID=A0A6L0WKL1_LEIIN|nr:hypothetical_protein [Leishmania infantum]SUZ39200.1 hypothetical_protein [Leishmania infantum]
MVFDYDADTGSYTVFWPLAASCTAVSSVLGVMKTPKRRVAYKGSAVTQELWIAVHRNGPHPTRRERLSGGGGEYSTSCAASRRVAKPSQRCSPPLPPPGRWCKRFGNVLAVLAHAQDRTHTTGAGAGGVPGPRH